MILKTGNVMDQIEIADLVLVTANSEVVKYNHLVMGAGAAKALADRFPKASTKFGNYVYNFWYYKVDYLIITLDIEDLLDYSGPKYVPKKYEVGIFQTKRSWKNPSSIELIKKSTLRLSSLAKSMYKDKTIALNFPGIGCGGLRREEVIPIIETLPDNVEIYELPKRKCVNVTLQGTFKGV